LSSGHAQKLHLEKLFESLLLFQFLQENVSLPMSKLDGKTYATSWLIDPISRKLSNNNEVSFSDPYCSFDICLKDGLSSHNKEKDEDQIILSPHDQLNDNVGIFQEFLYRQCSWSQKEN
jgi:hypothetical protein